MALRDRLPRHLFTTRGWGLMAAGILCLLCAQMMGRRDLLALGVFLVVLPLISLAGIRLVKPRFRVYREFSPSTVETDSVTTVRLAVARTGPGTGRVVMEERLPPRFGESPAFHFPARSSSGGTSRYEYRLRSGRRGQFTIGPVTAEFTDPFGLSLHRHTIDDGDTLTVTPAAVELPPTGLAGARGNDGITATRIRANPSDDDVMTREYRHGDPMRRVHWPATARHGALMVRQEESVTTPEATIILDQRFAAHSSGFGPVFTGAGDDGHLITSDTFEWAVTAAMSVSAHLSERNYALRFLDAAGEPGFRRSPSAPEPDSEEYRGAAGLQSIAESLAAIQLTGQHHLRREHDPVRREHPAGGESGQAVFDDLLMDKLAAHRMRGPVLALLGRMSLAEAHALAPASAYAANAFAIVVTDRTSESAEVLDTLRQGGWRAVAVDAATSLPAAWTYFDEGDATVAAAAADVRRGAEVAR
ncbi:DUF58 domain-containing protein [Arthrobacter sp. D1-17]